MTNIGRDAWVRGLLAAQNRVEWGDADQVNAATVAGALADTLAVGYGDAVDAVEGAIEDGPLAEDDDGTITGPDAAADAWIADRVEHTGARRWIDEFGEYDQLMTAPKGNKNAFAPWGDPDHPEGAEDKDARYKWAIPDMWRGLETAREWVEKDPSLSASLMFILQREADPYREPADPLLLIDGDDVVDDKGRVHPEFRRLVAELIPAPAHAALSSSDHGIHIPVRGRLPRNVKQLKIPLDGDVEGFSTDHIDEGEGDGLHVDIFDGKHLWKATGKHIDGTPEATGVVDAAVLKDYCDEYDATLGIGAEGGTVEDVDVSDVDYDGDDPDEWDIPEDETLAYRACVEAHYQGYAEEHTNYWRITGYATAHGQAIGKTRDEIIADLKGEYREGEAAGFGGKTRDRVRYDHQRAQDGEFAPPGHAMLANYGILPPRFANEGSAPSRSTVEVCEPPRTDRESFEASEHWDHLQAERYDEFVGADGPVVWADQAGSGKTTNAGIAAAERDRSHVILFDKHEKAREYVLDDETPDEYYHLKGGEQKRRGHCMDADHADDPCPEHGNTGDCPHMCPVYDLDVEADFRQRYEEITDEVGPVRAHMILGEQLPGHDEDGGCRWLEQFGELESTDHVVGVHEYQPLKTVRDGRDVIVDESPDSLKSERAFDVEQLVRAANTLEKLGKYSGTPDALQEFSRLASDLVAVLTDEDAPDGLDAIKAPEIDAETIHWEVDPDDLPDGVDPDEVQTESIKEYPGMPEEGYRTRERQYVKRDLIAEELAQAKLEYNETLVERMRNGNWDGAPLCFDALLAAAVEAGLDADAARQAIAVPTVLEYCPWCGSELGADQGARVCSSEDCEWHEEHHSITQRDGERARAQAWVDHDGDVADSSGVVYERLPLVSELPDKPLVLDATATPSKVAGVYGVSVDDVEVYGDEPLATGLHTTQVLDGQYHWSTINDSETARERIQRTVDTVADVHECPLLVGREKVRQIIDLPPNAEFLHYHAARGLNREECDAVVAIGAPHPDVSDLRREAGLLAHGHPDLTVGGDEHSTRRDAPNPPVYRKLLYSDEQGRGRAVATKHYTGLVGDLFRETREKELVQVVHRIRPLLADETKHAYLLTNVPTSLPVDEVCEFDELADPLEALLPVPDRALDLLEHVRDVHAGGAPDGFRAEALFEKQEDGTVANKAKGYHRLARLQGMDVSERQVYNWIDALEAVGLLRPEKYEQHAGVSYTADIATLKSALSVLSSNASFKVAAIRRFRHLVEETNGSLEWLRWAQEALDLGGDRCGLPPPPGSPG